MDLSLVVLGIKTDMASFTNNPILTDRYNQALQWAMELHKFQIRKNGTPYVAHLLQVSGIILEHGGTEDQAIAGLLHDAIEDVNVSAKEIEDRFGSEVAAMVVAVSEDKTISKDQRKMAYAKSIRNMGSAALVSAADKLHNLRCYLIAPELVDRSLLEFYLALRRSYEFVAWRDDCVDSVMNQMGWLIEDLKKMVKESEDIAKPIDLEAFTQHVTELKAKYQD